MVFSPRFSSEAPELPSIDEAVEVDALAIALRTLRAKSREKPFANKHIEDFFAQEIKRLDQTLCLIRDLNGINPKSQKDLFIGKLNKYTTKEDLFCKFSEFGAIAAKVMYDKVSGECIGFVHFGSTENCEVAYLKFKNNCIINGKKVIIDFCNMEHSMFLEPNSERNSKRSRNVTDEIRPESENSGIEDFAKSLLFVADNLKRIAESRNSCVANQRLEHTIQHVERVERRLKEVFEKQGLIRFDPINEKFESQKHFAVFHTYDASKPPGTIVAVLESGYYMFDRVLRPAEVGVANMEKGP